MQIKKRAWANNALVYELSQAKSTNTLGFIDFDDCLDATTVRNLTDEKKQLLWDLHHLTNGGWIITTNSAGPSILEMQGMDGFPIISEFATVYRNILGFNTEIDTPIYKAAQPNVQKAFEVATEIAKQHGVTLVETGEELAIKESIKLEGDKEMGIAAVFGSHVVLEPIAREMVEHAFKAANISKETHEIDYKGKDAREIKVKGTSKADVVEHIQSISRLNDRTVKFAMGDSGSDLEVMRKLNRGIVVGHAIPDSKLSFMRHCRITTDGKDFGGSWQLMDYLRSSWRSKTHGVILP